MREDDPSDAVDTVIAQWRRERPDLDLSAMGLFARMTRIAQLAGPRLEEVFARHGLRQGEFDVLAALRRSDEPYALMPSELSAALMMSRAGMTNRLDRLEEAGLVERRLSPTDRRSFRVRLTAEGRAVVDAALTDHAANLARLVAGLAPAERDVLDQALRALARALDTAPEAP
ncbi:MarR family winged helix-turn-helix transcriptional regulator [Streptomonospora nanhaiensis]|uniref:MarR family winged helix-turn-helix transcriptional regulator n=1 Tax=Streptomonospora nanhaiensis TaxID=1323731 RepID=UPI001C997AF2|nr:MarR family transcriptional regulator [Streptomonospora nanhaiensis]MBX9389957.1 MarR family transcriptional regulator [Streptomonospora nanhaiensis]